MCVHAGLEMYLYGSICVRDKVGEIRRVHATVCVHAFAAATGDICHVVGWELSAVGREGPQTKEMKAEVTTWTGGTRHGGLRNTQTQSHVRTHTHTASLSHTHKNAGGTQKTQGREAKEEKKKKTS